MLLEQISPNDPVSLVAMQGLLSSAPILLDAQFFLGAGAAAAIKKAASGETKTKITRSINESNTATGGTRTYDTTAKKIVSFDAKVDVVVEDRNEDPEAELAYQTRKEAEEAGYVLQELFFEGDTGDDSEDFDGMRELVDSSWVQTIDTDGIELSLGNSDTAVTNQQMAIEALLKLFATVRGGATHAYMNEYLKVRWLTIAKNLGYYRMTLDALGQPIEMIGNVIIRGAGYQEDGTPLLPFDETVGGSNDCSSIFAVRWGERNNLTCITSAGLKGRYAGQYGNFLINNVNLDMALLLQDTTALVQSKGWRI
jgi:hypothetical protein